MEEWNAGWELRHEEEVAGEISLPLNLSLVYYACSEIIQQRFCLKSLPDRLGCLTSMSKGL